MKLLEYLRQLQTNPNLTCGRLLDVPSSKLKPYKLRKKYFDFYATPTG